MDGNVRRLRLAPDELGDDRFLLDTLLEHMPDQIYFKDVKSRFVRISRTQAVRWGLDDPADAIGKTDFDFFSDEHAQAAFADEQRLLQTGEPLIGIEERETWLDGGEAWVSTTKVPLRDRSGEIIGLFGISRDITDKKRNEHRLAEQSAKLADQAQELERLTLVDELTGLYNRRGLQTFGEQALYRSRRDGSPLSLLFLDLDGLKQINDQMGHAAGDLVLKGFSERLRKAIRGSDLAVRLGGDEFLVLLPECRADEVRHVLNRLEGLEVDFDAKTIPVRFSRGWTDYKSGETAEEFMRRCDEALYENKRSGKKQTEPQASPVPQPTA